MSLGNDVESGNNLSAPAGGGDVLDVDTAVRERYAAAAQAAEAALCCPVDYDRTFLEVLPQELIDRDYGCGDPSKYLRAGETVLDLGSGGGKICYIASQVVGAEGCVIGVDVNDKMLALARQFQDEVSKNIGHRNVEFRKGRIQDLALDLDEFEAYLIEHPIQSSSDWLDAQAAADAQRRTRPMIADESIDVIVSNCVLNLVSEAERRQLFAEMFRVLKPGGRAVISDITSDEVVPAALRNDADLWSGCISGAFVEQEFPRAFEQAGFHGIEILAHQQEAWATVEGIEFRSMTIQAVKPAVGSCLDHHQAVIYQGPWKSVTTDEGHTLRRGTRVAICAKHYEMYTAEPYQSSIVAIDPKQPINGASAKEMDCGLTAERPAAETKGAAFRLTMLPGDGDCCEVSGCC